MPTELRFANPHSAKVAMVNETGSRLPFIGPRCAYAMNSLITIRSPSSAPTVPLSCQGTPITNAIGVPWHDSGTVGALLGERMVINEFIAYAHLGPMKGSLDPVSFTIANAIGRKIQPST